MSGYLFLAGDVYKLENQIPLWLINLLIPLIFQGQQSQSFLCNFLNYAVFWDQNMNMTQLPWGNGEEEEEEEEEPLHLLEALHRTILHLAKKQDSSNILRLINKHSQPRKESSRTDVGMVNSPFRSVTDLKAKGIHFRRSSPCLTDIQFLSFAFYGQLHLPFLYVNQNTMIAYSNFIAFEMSPATETNYGIISYINFMKTLIETAKDVKVLRENGILYSMLASDEEVVRIFKSIDTYGFCNDDLFNDVKMRIDDHCKSKAKTWIAELINTNFRSPWTIIALFAAAFLLCLTFLQTYYTLNPRT